MCPMRIPVHCATYATLQSVVNFSTYSDRKSCNTSTTLQNSVARFVSGSWASVAVAAARKRRRRNRSCWVSDFNFDSMVFINIHEVSTLLPIRSTLLPIPSTWSLVCMGPKQHAKLTVLNSTLLSVCTGLYMLTFLVTACTLIVCPVCL